MLPHTAMLGVNIIDRELTTLNRDWDSFKLKMEEVGKALEARQQQWESLAAQYTALLQWLAEQEVSWRQVEPVSTLIEKQTETNQVKVKK